ncbi:MAG: hypothetical protein ACOYKR_08985, partial [Sphingobacterium thalpophilum]
FFFLCCKVTVFQFSYCHDKVESYLLKMRGLGLQALPPNTLQMEPAFRLRNLSKEENIFF